MKAYLGKIDERTHDGNIIFCDPTYNFDIAKVFKNLKLGEHLYNKLSMFTSRDDISTRPYIILRHLNKVYIFCRGVSTSEFNNVVGVRIKLDQILKYIFYEFEKLNILDIGVSLPVDKEILGVEDISYSDIVTKYIVSKRLNSNVIKLKNFNITIYIEDREDNKGVLTFLKELPYIDFIDNRESTGLFAINNIGGVLSADTTKRAFNSQEDMAHLVKQYNLKVLTDSEIQAKLQSMPPNAKSHIQKCIKNGTIQMCTKGGEIFFIGESTHAFTVQAMLENAEKDYLIWASKEGHRVFLEISEYVREYMSDFKRENLSNDNITEHFAVGLLHGELPKHITCYIKDYGDLSLFDLTKNDIIGLFSLCGIFTWSLPRIEGCEDFEVNIKDGYSGFITKTEFDDDNLWVVNESLLLRELAKYVFSGEIPDFVYMKEEGKLIDLDETTLIELEKYIIATQKR
ncbi:hypothetical protein D3C81_08120 [compost metagenome]